MLPRRRAMRQARRDVQAALRAEPFDRRKLDQSLARLRAETSEAQRELHTALAELAEQLSPLERKKLADATARFRRLAGRQGDANGRATLTAGRR